MTELYLVRHTEVEPVAAVPAPDWLPTPAGLAAAERLATAPVWRSVTVVATSPEPKARATAAPIAREAGLPLRVEPDLREVGRPGQPLVRRTDYVALVAAYFAGEPVAAWEPAEAARRRIGACIERIAADAAGPLAVVSHGLVLSLHLGLTLAEWNAIPLPAVAEAPGPFLGVDEFLRAQRSS
jgi:probable phosphoglycerate mutase